MGGPYYDQYYEIRDPYLERVNPYYDPYYDP